ncbi:hypothetical protein MPOCJGCO_0040 [Methylobacterium trifolii]|uniref:Uncharacterized protein n=1 Tax=Methylobacterium trifolii TaxID=1003092 RepID=A0ABQ4TU52_9HYPH|nr:hypothetical protein MPOCJGCO_0040 [Methylobacterium trifolii]
MRAPSRMSASAPVTSAPARAGWPRMPWSAGSELSTTSTAEAPKATARAQISEPIEPPPPVTMTRRPERKRSRRGRSMATVGRRSRSSISRGASSASRMPSPRLTTRASGRPRRRARAMRSSGSASGASALGVATRRRTGWPRSASAPITRSRSAKPPSTGTPRIICPASSARGDRMPLGESFFTEPDSMARSSTSMSPPRPRSSVGTVAARALDWREREYFR